MGNPPFWIIVKIGHLLFSFLVIARLRSTTIFSTSYLDHLLFWAICNFGRWMQELSIGHNWGASQRFFSWVSRSCTFKSIQILIIINSSFHVFYIFYILGFSIFPKSIIFSIFSKFSIFSILPLASSQLLSNCMLTSKFLEVWLQVGTPRVAYIYQFGRILYLVYLISLYFGKTR